MAQEIKFTKEEMESLQNLQQTYVGIQNAFGQVSVSKLRLDQQFEELEKADENLRTQWTDTQDKEREFVKSINKKYGDGNLDISTGVFTPNAAAAVEETPATTEKTS